MENKSIELLAPAGDMDALKAAIANGAGAIYLGLDAFNARIRAKNFTRENLGEAITLAHAHGVKVFVTLNTEIYDREISALLDTVSFLWMSGVDALIVADFGITSLLRERFPDFEIHASTQSSAHNLDGVELLNSTLGFSRVVVARELDKENIEYITKNAPCEIEVFIHGAHCMSVSGQCLMSYAMGGRSGNRGECAQPCRLPYKICGKSGYHLSLKDMSLSSHITELLESGVASLKVEGRMKGASYVGGTIGILSALLREKRNATGKERQRLEALFSRQGFSDGYFTGRIDKSMLGIRTEENKASTEQVSEKEAAPLQKVPVDLFAEFIIGQRAKLTIVRKDKSATVYGDIVEEAINAPISREDIAKSLSKLGQTPYTASEIHIEKSESVMVRVSSLNALRRSAVLALDAAMRKEIKTEYKQRSRGFSLPRRKTAVFFNPYAIPKNSGYFDVIFVPLWEYKRDTVANGIYMPPVIFDSEWEQVESALNEAYKNGVRYALVSNIGQVSRLKKMGFDITADFRFNVFNAPCVDYLMGLGFNGVILSPELTLPQINDLKGASVIVYGKIPVMTTHKCVLKDTVGCDRCRGYLEDRQGAKFFTLGLKDGHRNIIFNSVPVYMADRSEQISSNNPHFIFTDESEAEAYTVIEAYKRGSAPDFNVKRIK